MVSRLHLPSLTVEGFRGIRALELSDLGRVTLLAGKNSIGKTTILEAIRAFASRGDTWSLINLIETREELVPGSDEDGDEMLFPEIASLFHKYDPGMHARNPPLIRIGAKQGFHELSLRLVDDPDSETLFTEDISPKALSVCFGERESTIPVGPLRHYGQIKLRQRLPRKGRFRNPDSWPDPIVLESIGPGLLDNDKVARLWDSVALTKAEDFVTKTLRLVVGVKLERLAFLGDPSRSYRVRGRRVVDKMNSTSVPIPLKRLGDGAQRLLGIALALASCQNGILLIDEVENGIHYSIQPELWRMILRAAKESNVQVVAATHSSDCIAGFAAAAVESLEVGTLIRLESVGDGLHAVQYSEAGLEVAAQQMIEVR